MPAVIHVYHESADALADRIRPAAPEREVVALTSPRALAEAMPALDVVFAPMPPRDGWARATRLRLIQLLGAGVDQLLPSPDLPARVEVAGVRGVFAAEVAEHAIAMLLAHVARLPALYSDQRSRRFAPHPHGTLAGARLAIVGRGEVGRRVERIARALDMTVRAFGRRDVLDLGDARYVVICVPLTPATARMFDAARLATLGRGAFVVNVARGGIVDERALAASLTAGHLAGAALDVFDDEPLPPASPLWDVPNLTITPHVAGLGDHYVDRCIAVLIANARALDAGESRRCLVDRDAGY